MSELFPLESLTGEVVSPESAEVIPEHVRWVARVPAWNGFGNAISPVLAAEVLGAILDGPP